MKIRNLALCASVALLAACGGGGGSSSAPPATGGGGGGGGGAAPTPTPPPGSVLPTFLELTGVQTFESACAKGADNTQSPFIAEFGQGTEHEFDIANQNWRVSGSAPPNNIFDFQFAAADITSPDGDPTVIYRRPSQDTTGNNIFVFVTPQYTSGPADYVRGSFLSAPVANNAPIALYCVFGVATPADETLPTSPITYSAEIGVAGDIVNFGPAGVTAYSATPTTVSITADPATGELTISLEVRGFERSTDPNTGQLVLATTATEFGTYTGSAFVAAGTQTFTGFLDKPSGIAVNTQTTGWFFGPQGAEIGLVISSSEQLTDGSNLALALAITGQVD